MKQHQSQQTLAQFSWYSLPLDFDSSTGDGHVTVWGRDEVVGVGHVPALTPGGSLHAMTITHVHRHPENQRKENDTALMYED